MKPLPNFSPIGQRLAQVRWRRILPGLSVIGLVLVARSLGLFETMEWKALDAFLRWRPAEPADERFLIVGVTDADIQQVGTYPIPDADLAALLQALSDHEPRAIGIDIYRDFPVNDGYDELVEVLATPNIFGIEKVLGTYLPPPPALPRDRIGFVDFPLDQDGFVRRAYLGTLPSADFPEPERFRFSLPLKLAEAYLAEAGLQLDNGVRDPRNMRFGDAELPRFIPGTGGYVGNAADGIQMLIYPRSGETPFDVVSMTAVLSGQVDDRLIRDRIVLIGITAFSVKDLINSAAVDTDNPGLVYGVKMQAQVASQIISAVLDERPMLWSWPAAGEVVWIVGWGTVGLLVISWRLPTLQHAAVTLGLSLLLVVLCLALLWSVGLWLPVVPTVMLFWLLTLPGFFLYEVTLRSRIEERQRVIERTYDAIHNGPLQTLALLLKQKAALDDAVGHKLENLNHELRAIYTRLMQESLPQEDRLSLEGDHVIDLRGSLKESLYEVYTETLKRDFPGFQSLKFQVVKFEPLQTGKLTSDDKRSLCRFLEECLCNVGKHAVAPTRLTVICMATAQHNLIQVADNGQPAPLPLAADGGRGTQQAQALAQRLRGTFQRCHGETGTTCELTWPLRRA